MSFVSKRRSAAVLAAALLGVSFAGCSHAGSSVVPTVSKASARFVGRPMVVTRQTHSVITANSAGAGRAILNPSTTIRGTVTTLPAILGQVTAVAYDVADSHIYAAESVNQQGQNEQIVRIDKAGATSVFATIPAYSIGGMTYDSVTKMLYVCLFGSNGNTSIPALYQINSSGTATLLAGGNSTGFVDGSGSGASFTNPTGITVDGTDGALYVTDSDRVRRVTTSGVVTTLTPAGSLGGQYGYNGHYGITWNATDGNLYVADAPADLIRKITPSGSVSTLAGRCVPATSYYGCSQLARDGTGTNALFASPDGIVSDSTGLYIADSGNNAIRKLTLAGTVTTFAGSGLSQDYDGAGRSAGIDNPQGIAIGSGHLYVTDTNPSDNLSGLRAVLLTGSTPPPPVTPITLYDTVSAAAMPYAIDWRGGTNPPSNVLWYTELDGHIASLTTAGLSTEYSAGGTSGQSPSDIVLGGDGAPWFLDPYDLKMETRTLSGQLLGFNFNGYCCGQNARADILAYGSDGSVWFINGGQQLVSVSPQGAVSYVSIPPQTYGTYTSLVFGKDGTIWLGSNQSIEHVDRTGNVLGSYNYAAPFVTLGADGNIWFTQSDAVGSINVTTGLIQVFPIYQPIVGCTFNCSRGIGAMIAGSDGAYWFVETQVGEIGRLDPTGGFTEYPILAAHHSPGDIVAGPDGNVWFVDQGAQKIGKFDLKKR